jgi:UDP-2,3-diacylglucosamine hydrolase
LGPGDGKYKFLKKFFTNSTLQWLTARIHPNLLLYLAHSWSQHSRLHSTDSPVFLNDNEWLYQHCIDTLKTQPDIDFFIFGHRHLPINVPIADTHSQYLNTGDWLHHNTFVKYDGSNAILERYQNTF